MPRLSAVGISGLRAGEDVNTFKRFECDVEILCVDRISVQSDRLFLHLYCSCVRK